MMEKFDAKRYRRRLLARRVFMRVVLLLMAALWVHDLVNKTDVVNGAAVFWILMMSHLRERSRLACDEFKALKDDVELRRVWDAEHDERYITLCAKSGIPVLSNLGIVLVCTGTLVNLWAENVGQWIIFAALLLSGICIFRHSHWEKRLAQEAAEKAEEA